ncbi:MAG TPA: DUF4340 domain-containing protein [Stellaceae bacterium]|jgi:hypothetical protein|nr:DUF4340 domain-containing protein [Stellaceae bacterium]
MRTTSLGLLALVTVIAAAGAILLPDNGGSIVPPAPPKPVSVLPGLKDWIGNADDLILRTSVNTVELTRQGQAPWTVAQKDNYPADPAKVADLLKRLPTLETVAPKTADPKLYRRLDVGGPDAHDHGDDPQSTLLSLKDSAKHQAALVIGKVHSDAISGSDDGAYVRQPDAARSWLAKPSLQVSAQTLDWIDPTIVDIDPATVTSIALQPAGAASASLTFSHPANAAAATPWHVEGIPASAKLKPGDSGADLAALLHPLHLSDVGRSRRITAKPDAMVHVTTKDGLQLAISIFKLPDTKKPGPFPTGTWIELQADGSGAAAARAHDIDMKTGPWAYKIDDDTAKQLTESAADIVEAPPAAPGKTPAAAQ